MEENAKKELHQCKECGLRYKDKSAAEKCEEWCKEHKTCNIEIIKHSEENKNGELGELKKKCEEYLNNWKRERADFLNYKKNEAERAGVLVKYAKEDMILKILPVLDNIELAEKQLPENLKKGAEGSPQVIEWTKGFLQIKKQLEEFLKKDGVETIETTGKKFDPETMEAVEEISIAEHLTPNTIVEELQRGYIMEGKVIRPAKVKISK